MSEKKLTPTQKRALERIGKDWMRCPLGVRSGTLLSLKKEGLLQYRISPEFNPISASFWPYTSSDYEWRATPPTTQPTQ